MTIPLVGVPIPTVGAQVKRIIIELTPTGVEEQHQMRVLTEGVEDKSWEWVHRVMAEALVLPFQSHVQMAVQQAVMGLMASPHSGVKH